MSDAVLVLNAGGYTHTSVAIRDAVAGVSGELEAVAIRFGIKQQRDPILCPQPRLGVDQRAALANVDLRREIGTLVLRRGDTLGDHQILDHQLVHPDIKIGQQRRIGIAWQKLRQPCQPPALRGEFADVEPGPQPVQGSPIEPHHRDRQERTFGVTHHHRAQHRLPVDIALDPADREAQARGGGNGRDLVSDETLTDRGGEEQRGEEERREDNRQRPAQPLTPAPRARPLRRRGVWRGCGVLDHQNAWPRLT